MSQNLIYDGLIQGLITVLAFISFIGICVYAYGPSRRSAFDRAAAEPLSDDAEEPKS
jgi:cytochrome c oxidase cbb3-type subunit 4